MSPLVSIPGRYWLLFYIAYGSLYFSSVSFWRFKELYADIQVGYHATCICACYTPTYFSFKSFLDLWMFYENEIIQQIFCRYIHAKYRCLFFVNCYSRQVLKKKYWTTADSILLLDLSVVQRLVIIRYACLLMCVEQEHKVKANDARTLDVSQFPPAHSVSLRQ